MIKTKKIYTTAAALTSVTAFIVIILTIWIAKWGEAFAKASVSNSDTITVLFYNVQNLFDMKKDGKEYIEYQPLKYNWNWKTYRIKLDNISSVLAQVNAEIVTLAEIENLNALKDLRNKLIAKGIRYPYFAIGDKPNKTNTCPALLSKFHIVYSAGLPGPKTLNYYSRNILEADVQIGFRRLKIFVNHWPSKKHPESTRLQAATTLRDRLNTLSDTTDYIIIGDLNANYNEFETFIKSKLNDTKGKTSINHVLCTITYDSAQSPTFVDETFLQTNRGFWHYNLWLELPVIQRMSYIYRGKKETPDNILLPGALYDSIGISYIDNSFEVFTWYGRLIKDGKIFGWKIKRVAAKPYHAAEGYSDHLPILARFRYGPFCKSGSEKK